MSSETPPTSAAGILGYQNESEPIVESLSSDNMTHSYGDLRQSGEWTVVTCKCCSSPSSLAEDATTPSMEKLVCICSKNSNMATDCDSNGSSSDVAVINDSDVDEVASYDLDGIPRISTLALLSDQSHVNVLTESMKSSEEKASEKSLRKTSRLRLRLKQFPTSNYSSIDSTNDGISSMSEARSYKKANKKSRRNKISEQNVLTMERTITFSLCLILISCVIALFCLVFAFLVRYFDQAELSPIKNNPLFSDVEELEKEFTKCLDLKTKGQDCKLNLKRWKISLVELLVDENQRISKLIQKLDQVDGNTEPENKNIPSVDKPVQENIGIETVEKRSEVNPDISEYSKKLEHGFAPAQKVFSNIPEYDADSTSKNQLRDEIMRQNHKSLNPTHAPYSDIEEEFDDEMEVDDEYDDIEIETETAEEENEWKTVESLKLQMESLRNLYDLERSENAKLRKVFEDQKQAKPLQEEEKKMEESNDFLGMGDYANTIWKGVKKAASNINPNLDKYRKKLAKVIEDNFGKANDFSDKLRKKWAKNSEKLAKRLKKLQKAWNEDDNCDEDSTNCDQNSDNVKDTLNEFNSKADWYTKRFTTLNGESHDNLDDNNPDNWVFKRAKGREEMHSLKNKKQKKFKNDGVKKKKRGTQE